MTQKLLRVNDLQELFQLSRQGIYQMLKENKLPQPLRLGRLLRWKPEVIETFLSTKEKGEIL